MFVGSDICLTSLFVIFETFKMAARPAPNVAMMVGAAAPPPPVTQSMPQGLPPGAMHPAAMRPAHAIPGAMPGGHCAMAPHAMPGAMPPGAIVPQMAGVPMPAIPLHTSNVRVTAPVMLQGHAPSQPAATMPLRPTNYGVPPMAPLRPAVTASPYLQASGLGAPMASQIPGTMGDLGISEKIAAASTVVRTGAKFWWRLVDTVDGRNPAPLGMYKTL